MSGEPEAPARRSSYITPEGAQRLRDELSYLWKEERPRVTRQVADAAALGDRSENAEYIYGKRRLREIDRRLHYLSKRLEELTVVTPNPANAARVYFGAWVRLESEDGATLEYRVVGPDEADVERGSISMDSPLGRALLSRAEGDEIAVRRPAGVASYTILKIQYAPFAASGAEETA
jgi:transcription elongation factor GreB